MNDRVRERFKFLKNEFVSVPLTLLFLVLISYGLLIPWMGFYWDDLPFVWFLRFFGPSEFIVAFQPFRPLVGYIFAITTALFGGHPLTWQILGLIVRFLLGLEVWFLFRQVWTRQRQAAIWVALIFTLYPAYRQQWVAFTHINQELIPFLCLLASFILTTWGVRNQRLSIPLTSGALFLQALGLFSTEYFFGLEILRFFFSIAILRDLMRDQKNVLKRSFQIWLPYLVVWVLNALWTYFYHRSTAYNSYKIDILSLLSPIGLLNEFLNTLSLSAFKSWLGAFDLFAVIDGSITQILLLIILVVAGVSAFVAVRALNGQEATEPGENDSFGWWAMGIGLLGIFAGRLPSWAVSLPLKIEFDYDRFFISIMLGASLFIIGLAEILLRGGRRKVILLSLLIGILAANQFAVANTFRRDWSNEQNFFWQMAWRMPAIKEGTAIVAYDLPLKYASDLQLTAPLNWMYVPGFQSRELPYALLFLKTRFSMSEIQPAQPITLPYRTVNFNGSTSKMVVIYQEAGGCLRVLDPLYNGVETVPGANPYLVNAIPLSDPSLIQTDAPLPEMNATLFGSEPEHSWCYVYEKAEIERLKGNWENVVNLYTQAQKDELNPGLPVEYLPFVEAFALTGDTKTALKLTDRTIKEQKLLCPAILEVWKRVLQGQEIPTEVQSVLQRGCPSF